MGEKEKKRWQKKIERSSPNTKLNITIFKSIPSKIKGVK